MLVDERADRRIARRLNLRPQGLIAVLLEGKSKGHVPALAPLLDRLEVEARFWLSLNIYQPSSRSRTTRLARNSPGDLGGIEPNARTIEEAALPTLTNSDSPPQLGRLP